jgi:hypothetical protein
LTIEVKEANTFRTQLKLLGNAGWELVSTFTVASKALGFWDSGSETSGVVAVFKRPK